MKGNEKIGRVLDSFALLAFLQDEQGAERVKTILQETECGKNQAYINTVNLGEVYYIIARAHGHDSADADMLILREVVQVEPATVDLVMGAARLKADHALSYADCFAVATAQSLDLPLLTGDSEFKSVENLVTVEWL